MLQNEGGTFHSRQEEVVLGLGPDSFMVAWVEVAPLTRSWLGGWRLLPCEVLSCPGACPLRRDAPAQSRAGLRRVGATSSGAGTSDSWLTDEERWAECVAGDTTVLAPRKETDLEGPANVSCQLRSGIHVSGVV